ncbi:alpha/beta-hydrolase [Calocera viscosa TUFC12733]|uniref:Alpha/beta-hydrolase n=1 Tax=Calocera viscosa (strain TUFC12733) TaxID=1330018 RepID=A0A167FP73_CALVF|nr:alpha/beta-hydrolase [Calocera viscosa TUFC12733]
MAQDEQRCVTSVLNEQLSKYPIYLTQPKRALWLIINLLSLPSLYIYWTLSNLLPFWRPLPTWPLHRAVNAKLIRWATNTFFRAAQLPRPDLRHEPGEHERAVLKSEYGARFVWIEGVDVREVGEPVRGWAEAAGVEGARVPAYWMGEAVESLSAGRGGGRAFRGSEQVVYRDMEQREGHPGPSGKHRVMLFLHGGSYVTGSAHPSELTSFTPINCLRYSETVRATLSVEYRLSSGFPLAAENPFPAALLDAISGFRYLLSLGFSPHEILISGDSAGGNLAIALVRYLVDSEGIGSGLAGAVLLSPWCDLSDSHEGPESSLIRNYETDFLLGPNASMGAYCVNAFCGKMSPRNPWISPSAKAAVAEPPDAGPSGLQEARFIGWPRTLVVPGQREMLVDEMRTLHQRMERDAVPLVYKEWPDAPHDLLAMWFMEPERTEAIKFVCKWIDELEASQDAPQ